MLNSLVMKPSKLVRQFFLGALYSEAKVPIGTNQQLLEMLPANNGCCHRGQARP